MQYLGIPYAQPPVGKLRFMRPVTDPLPSWNDVKNATQFAPSCQQASGQLKLHEKLYKRLLPPDVPDPGFSEDCLYLNIFVPNEGMRSIVHARVGIRIYMQNSIALGVRRVYFQIAFKHEFRYIY